MNAKEVGETILGIKVETPITKEFDEKYGQKGKRWWDDVELDDDKCSKQKYHVAGHFLCYFYYGDAPSNCKRNWRECSKCLETNFENIKREKEPIKSEIIYNSRMNPPEMVLWLYEALSLRNEDELKDLCKKYEDNRRFSPEDKIKWEVIEEELEKIKG